MTTELKATVINMKTLTQDIDDPIIAHSGDANGFALRIIFTQEAAAQFTKNTKVYLSWLHIEENIKGYNVFTEVIKSDDENFPPTWEIHYPRAMLHDGNVLACIQIVDEISIASSKNFIIHVLIDPNDGSDFVNSNDFTEFQQAVIELATTQDLAEAQMIEQQTAFETMQLIFENMQEELSNFQDSIEETVDDFILNAQTEIHNTIETEKLNAAITVTKTVGEPNDNYIYRYVFHQGGTDIVNGTIDIAKDMVATSGEIIYPTVQNPIVINNENITSGIYIAITIANSDTFYINVADLIEYNSVSSNTEIILTDINHTITASVGEIAASKIRYSGTQTVAQAIDMLETAASIGVDNKILTAIENLDANMNATLGVNDTDIEAVAVMTGITETNGIVANINSIAVDAAGAATRAKNTVIGTLNDTSNDVTIYGTKAYAQTYVDNALTWGTISS